MRVTLHRRPTSRRPRRASVRRTCERSPLDRSSTPWRDGIGSGFAVGATQEVIDLVTRPPRRETFSGGSS